MDTENQGRKWMFYVGMLLLCTFITGSIWAKAAFGSQIVAETEQTLSEVTVVHETPAVVTVPETTEPAVTQATEPVPSVKLGTTNFLLIGQNQNLADTMILCSVDRDRKTMTLISFLRDLYLPIPAYKGHPGDHNRMNACYYWGSKWAGDPKGGMELLSLCIQENFGIDIDHCISVDFDAFSQAIDLMGGVEIELTEQEAKYLSKKVGYVGDMEPGMQTLNGLEALAYSRIRKIDSDVQRTQRQRKVLSALLEKCRSMSLGQLTDVARKIIPNIETDLSVWELTGYLLELMPQWKEYSLNSVTCPADNAELPGSCWYKTVKIGGTDCSVIECDRQRNREYLSEVLGDTCDTAAS